MLKSHVTREQTRDVVGKIDCIWQVFRLNVRPCVIVTFKKVVIGKVV